MDGDYICAKRHGHPRAHKGYVREHILVAEDALGHYLPEGAVVHHVDEDTKNNDPSNLVICQNDTYHKLIHVRMRAFKACGHVDWMKCGICKQYDDPGNMSVVKVKRGGSFYLRSYHKACNTQAGQKRRESKSKPSPSPALN